MCMAGAFMCEIGSDFFVYIIVGSAGHRDCPIINLIYYNYHHYIFKY